MQTDNFEYIGDRFADIQMLRYKLSGFDELTLQQKQLVYYLSEATLWGRDITFDQFGKYNLQIRKLFETIYQYFDGDREAEEFKSVVTYLKRVWFSNGIHHHYGCDKFVPGFTKEFLLDVVVSLPKELFSMPTGDNLVDMMDELVRVVFDQDIMPKRVNQADGIDKVASSACNFYEGLTQREVEDFYSIQKAGQSSDEEPVSTGLNTKLVKENGCVVEKAWKENGLYGEAITKICYWLEKAREVSENDLQKQYIESLITFYKTGDLRAFNKYCVEWVLENNARVDFVNGFIEVYGDPLGLKGSWEGIVEYKDLEATKRTQTISSNAQWFEEHSPVDNRFKRQQVKGVTANVICAAMLGGDEYPSTAIGINLPNADWIRSRYGSKSVTIGNITDAYNKASRGNGFLQEFVIDNDTIALIEKYGDSCDELHTDLHECLGHGSGQLLPGVAPDALKSYGSTIEEARADLFALYYVADEKMVSLGLTPDGEAFKSTYYTYMMNGLMTQLTRIAPGAQIEEAHMRNRALIARWCYEQGKEERVVEKVVREGNTFVRINDYKRLRSLIGVLLAEVQRIKSEGDFEAARLLVEEYAVTVDPVLHKEVLKRYKQLNIAPYKGFLNPLMTPVYDISGNISDVVLDYSEGYSEQMLRYSRDYSALL